MELVWDEKDRGVKPGDKKKTKKKNSFNTFFFWSLHQRRVKKFLFSCC